MNALENIERIRGYYENGFIMAIEAIELISKEISRAYKEAGKQYEAAEIGWNDFLKITADLEKISAAMLK